MTIPNYTYFNNKNNYYTTTITITTTTTCKQKIATSISQKYQGDDQCVEGIISHMYSCLHCDCTEHETGIDKYYLPEIGLL